MEKGGLTVALAEAGLRSGDEVYTSDEMRLGLRGVVRRVLAPKGVKVVQPLQLKYEWSYLLLAVNPKTGELRWRWIERMRQEHIKAVLSEWNLDGLIWDKAPSHRAKSLEGLSTKRVFLPSYSPELNPAERIFEEVRRRVEGRVYDSIEDKQAEVESYLRQLSVDRERVTSGCVDGNGCAKRSIDCRHRVRQQPDDNRHPYSELVLGSRGFVMLAYGHGRSFDEWKARLRASVNRLATFLT